MVTYHMVTYQMVTYQMVTYLLLLKATICRIRGSTRLGSFGRQSFSKDRGMIIFL